jgi:hypothetical protein
VESLEINIFTVIRVKGMINIMKRMTQAIIPMITISILIVVVIVVRQIGEWGVKRIVAEALKSSAIVKTWTSGETTVKLDDQGTLRISGNGMMRMRPTIFYSWFGDTTSFSPWCDSNTNVTNVVISTGVTSIGDEAFANCVDLASVTIPSSVNFIAISGFMIVFDRIIGDAFAGCTNLTSINVNKDNPSYRSIDGVLFAKDEEYKDYLALILYPQGRQGAYEIPKKVTHLSGKAFSGCTGLTSVIIPHKAILSQREINFDSCINLTSINVDQKNQNYSSVDGVLFNKDGTKLIRYPAGRQGSYTVPDAVKTISYGAFKDCVGLTSIVIPISVIDIDFSYIFIGCINLTSINVHKDNPSYSSTDGVLFDKNGKTLLRYPPSKQGSYNIPNTVNVLPYGAFHNCVGITSLTIPESVEKIEAFEFDNAIGLRSITILNHDPSAINHYTLVKIPDGVCLYVPQSSIKKYRDDHWFMEAFKCVKPIATANGL